MFFADSLGFFGLVSLIIQCGLAWIFAIFLGSLAPGRGAWLRSMFTAFVGLGIGLTAVSVRFVLAHVNVAGPQALGEGSPATHAFYGIYLGGKVMFLWGLVRGVSGWRCGYRQIAAWVPMLLVALGCVVGALLPTVEWVLLAQAPLIVASCLWCVRRLRPGMVEAGDDFGRASVRAALAVMAVAWIVYAAATINAGPSAPLQILPLGYVLRVNSLIDLVLQVVLASGVIIAVMADAVRSSLAAQAERDRLRQVLLRDEKLRSTATLVSGVAHEINNPLTAILGFVDGLADQDPAVREQAAGVVREQALRCRSIVQRMSLIGRRRALRPVCFDVGQAIERVVRGLRPQLDQAGVVVHTECVAGTTLVADATGFEQVLSNLLTNAMHVTRPGGAVEVQVQRGTELRLLVCDHGPGIREQERAHIFEPFWTTKEVGKGTGLGLAVVEAIVHSHGGKIEVAETRGGGAAFSVRWPLRERHDEKVPPPPVLAAAVEPAPAGGRLLVIDDEAPVRMTIRRYAELQGWQVVECESAEQGLARIFDRGERFAAIVCDLRMPGLSGIDFHNELLRRAPELIAHTLFVTGDLASPEAASFAAQSRAAIIAKPFLMPELVRRIREVAAVA